VLQKIGQSVIFIIGNSIILMCRESLMSKPSERKNYMFKRPMSQIQDSSLVKAIFAKDEYTSDIDE